MASEDADLLPPSVDRIDVAAQVDRYVLDVAEDIWPRTFESAQPQCLE
ncbi:hypothetical protein [Candidatus Palauibacter sp.]